MLCSHADTKALQAMTSNLSNQDANTVKCTFGDKALGLLQTTGTLNMSVGGPLYMDN